MNDHAQKQVFEIPDHLLDEIADASKREGVSIETFIRSAIHDKLHAAETNKYFAEKRAAFDRSAFRKILDREGGEFPQELDNQPV